VIPFLLSLTAVALDGIFQRQRLEIVHMPGMHPQSPEWYSAQFIGCVSNNLAAEGLRHRECSAIDGSTRRTLTEPFSPTVLPIGGNVPVRAQGISVFGTK
jgi:hypothetical protein